MKNNLILVKNSVLLLTMMSAVTVPMHSQANVPPFAFYLSLNGGLAYLTKGSWQRVDGPDGNEAIQYPINQPQKHNNPSYMAAIAFGYRPLGLPLRAELAYHYFSNNKNSWTTLLADPGQFAQVADAKLESHAILLNGYYDFTNNTSWTPYVTAGVGYGVNGMRFDYMTTDSQSSDHAVHTSGKKYTSNVVWKAGVGINYELTPEFLIGAQVDYFALGKANVAYELDGANYPYAKTSSRNATVGALTLTYRF